MKGFLVSLLLAVTVFGAFAQDIELPRPAVKSGMICFRQSMTEGIRTLRETGFPASEQSTN